MYCLQKALKVALFSFVASTVNLVNGDAITAEQKRLHTRGANRRMTIGMFTCMREACSNRGMCTGSVVLPLPMNQDECTCDSAGCDCRDGYTGDACEEKISSEEIISTRVVTAGGITVSALDYVPELSSDDIFVGGRHSVVGDFDNGDYVAFGLFLFLSTEGNSIQFQYSRPDENPNNSLEIRIDSETGPIAGSFSPINATGSHEVFIQSSPIALSGAAFPADLRPVYIYLRAKGGAGIMNLQNFIIYGGN